MFFPLPRFGREFLRDFGGAVEDRDGETFRLHVEHEVFAHDGEADEANIALIRVHFGYLLTDRGAARAAPYDLGGADGNFQITDPDHDRAAHPAAP